MPEKRVNFCLKLFLLSTEGYKAELLQLTPLNFLHWEFLLVKKLDIEKTKTTFIISVFNPIPTGPGHTRADSALGQ